MREYAPSTSSSSSEIGGGGGALGKRTLAETQLRNQPTPAPVELVEERESSVPFDDDVALQLIGGTVPGADETTAELPQPTGNAEGASQIDQEWYVLKRPWKGGEIEALLKLDSKNSATVGTEGDAGEAALLDTNFQTNLSGKASSRFKLEGELAKLESGGVDLGRLFAGAPSMSMKIEGGLGKVGNERPGAGVVEGPFVAAVFVADCSDLLSESQRARYKLVFEVKIEFTAPAVLDAISDFVKLENEAADAKRALDQAQTAMEEAKRARRAAEQALDKARKLKTGRSAAVRAAQEVLRKAKELYTSTRAGYTSALAVVEAFGARLAAVGDKLRRLMQILAPLERGLLKLAEKQAVKTVVRVLAHAVPVVNIALVAYDLYQLGGFMQDYSRGRATFRLSGGDMWDGEEGGIWVDDGEAPRGGGTEGNIIGPDPNPATSGAGTLPRLRDQPTVALTEDAFWAAGLIDDVDGIETTPTAAEWRALNKIIPEDLTPAEREEIKRRWKAQQGKLDDWNAGLLALRQTIDDVRKETRQPMKSGDLDAVGTNPGAQRIAAVLGGSGILTDAEYKVLVDTIPQDVTLEEIEKLKPYLQQKGPKADVRIIATWIEQLRRGEPITVPPRGPSSVLGPDGDVDDLGKVVEANVPATDDLDGDGDIDAGDAAIAAGNGNGTGAGNGGGLTPNGGGTTPTTRRGRGGGGGGTTGGRGGGEADVKIVPTDARGSGQVRVSFIVLTRKFKEGDTVQVQVRVLGRGMKPATMAATVIGLSPGAVTVRFNLTTRVKLVRSDGTGSGAIFEPGFTMTLDR